MTSIQDRLRAATARAMLLAVYAAVLGTAPLLAQDSSAPQGGMGRGMGRGDPAKMEDRQLERMTRQLGLTTDQAGQIKGIYADSDMQLKALRDDTSMAKEDKRSKMMSLMQDRQAKVRGVLTDDQKTKLDAVQAKMRERRQERGAGRGGMPPPPASASAVGIRSRYWRTSGS